MMTGELHRETVTIEGRDYELFELSAYDYVNWIAGVPGTPETPETPETPAAVGERLRANIARNTELIALSLHYGREEPFEAVLAEVRRYPRRVLDALYRVAVRLCELDDPKKADPGAPGN